jgi:hypothetical protein
MKRAIALAVSTMLLAASLAACGQGKPAVCSSVNDLKSSVQKIKDIDPTSSGALSKLQSDLKTVKSDFGRVKNDAKSQFATQISSVESSYASVRSSVQAAAASPNAATLAAAGTALKSLGAAISTLVDKIESTC